jgi:hypothetical protein
MCSLKKKKNKHNNTAFSTSTQKKITAYPSKQANGRNAVAMVTACKMLANQRACELGHAAKSDKKLGGLGGMLVVACYLIKELLKSISSDCMHY